MVVALVAKGSKIMFLGLLMSGVVLLLCCYACCFNFMVIGGRITVSDFVSLVSGDASLTRACWVL